MPVYACPKGHQSSESDFCSECGARIQAAPSIVMAGAAAPPAANANSPQTCPDCGAPRTDTSSNFCEVCGYNFSTGAHGNVHEEPLPPVVVDSVSPPAPEPVPELVPEPPEPEPAPPKEWTVTVAVDPSLAEPGGPEPPANVDPMTIRLDKSVNLIGRKSEKRAILPEIPLDLDDGVSHRHALLTRGDDGSLTLRDIGSSNGTRVNGADIKPMEDIALHDSDQIILGRWSRLTVKTV